MTENALITIVTVQGVRFEASAMGICSREHGKPGYWFVAKGECLVMDAQHIHAVELVPGGIHTCHTCGEVFRAARNVDAATGGILPSPEGGGPDAVPGQPADREIPSPKGDSPAE